MSTDSTALSREPCKHTTAAAGVNEQCAVCHDRCERCQQGEPQVTLSVCCSSHGKKLCHRDYRLTHFVEVCGCSRCEAEDLPRIYPPSPLPPPNRLLGHTADGNPARPL